MDRSHRTTLAEVYKNYFNICDHVSVYLDPSNPGLPSEQSTDLLQLWNTLLSKVPPLEGRLLDVGTGSSIHPLLISSRTVDEIIATGYLDRERAALSRWLIGEPGVVDITPCLEFAASFESTESKTVNATDITQRIKQKVKDVLQCDVTLANPLHPVASEPFDIVTSQLLLEAACPTDATFREGARNMATLIKPGGRLLLVSALACGSYGYKGNASAFPYHQVTTDYLQEVFTSLGFVDIQFEVVMKRGTQHKSTKAGFYAMHAVKKCSNRE